MPLSSVKVYDCVRSIICFFNRKIYLYSGCVKVSTVGVYSRPEPSLRLCLQYLDLTDCQLVDDANLCVIVSNCPQLAYLYLRRCTKITGK